MIINAKTVTKEQLLLAMLHSKHTYFESRFFVSNDTGVAKISRMLLAMHKAGLLSHHTFLTHRFPFYALTDDGRKVANGIQVTIDRKDTNIKRRVIAFLKDNDGSDSKTISRTIKKSYNDVIKSLRELSELNEVYMVKEGNQILWYSNEE